MSLSVINVEIVSRYLEDDIQFMGDCCEVMVNVGGKLANTYCGSNDGPGLGFAKAFIDGLSFMFGEESLKVEFKKVADYPE